MDFNNHSFAYAPQLTGGFTITTAAPLPPAPAPSRVPRITLQEAIEAVLEAKLKSNLSPLYLAGLRQYLTLFAKGREQMAIDDVTLETLEYWFQLRGGKPRSIQHNIGRLSSLFSFAVRRGWISENPCYRLEPIRIQPQSPRVLTVEEARALLDFCRAKKPQLLAWLVIGMFAGVRPHELLQLKWSNVDLGNGTVTIDASVSKVSRRRIVKLEPVAVEWLKLCDQSKPLALPLETMRYHRYDLAGAIRCKTWPPDLLRHSAASYLLALHQDAPKVAFWLGNSPRILMSHYWSLTTKEDAERFFAIRPE